MTRLSAENLSKSYRGRAVVKGVSLHLDEGEVVGLLGPNGAGKTTSFYMIAGLVPADGGIVKLGNDDLTQDAMHKRARMGIGYLAQEPSIFRRLSTEQNILAILELRGDLNRDEQRKLCDELLYEFSINHLAKHAAMALSGGERRRLEIARALAMNPKYILLDEPFAGVDPISVVDIQRIIGHLAERGIGILITDHNVRETLGICQRAYIINEGSVLTQGTPDEILEDPDVRSVYLGENFKL